MMAQAVAKLLRVKPHNFGCRISSVQIVGFDRPLVPSSDSLDVRLVVFAMATVVAAAYAAGPPLLRLVMA